MSTHHTLQASPHTLVQTSDIIAVALHERTGLPLKALVESTGTRETQLVFAWVALDAERTIDARGVGMPVPTPSTPGFGFVTKNDVSIRSITVSPETLHALSGRARPYAKLIEAMGIHEWIEHNLPGLDAIASQGPPTPQAAAPGL